MRQARRMLIAVTSKTQASWTWQAETGEITGSYQLVRKQQEELDELRNRGITSAVTQAMLEQTWKVVQEQVGEGSAMHGMINRVWSGHLSERMIGTCLTWEEYHRAIRTPQRFSGQ